MSRAANSIRKGLEKRSSTRGRASKQDYRVHVPEHAMASRPSVEAADDAAAFAARFGFSINTLRHGAGKREPKVHASVPHGHRPCTSCCSKGASNRVIAGVRGTKRRSPSPPDAAIIRPTGSYAYRSSILNHRALMFPIVTLHSSPGDTFVSEGPSPCGRRAASP